MRGLRLAAGRRPALLPELRRARWVAQPAAGGAAGARRSALSHRPRGTRRGGAPAPGAPLLQRLRCRERSQAARAASPPGARPAAPRATDLGAARAGVPRLRRAARGRRELAGRRHAGLRALAAEGRAPRHATPASARPQRLHPAPKRPSSEAAGEGSTPAPEAEPAATPTPAAAPSKTSPAATTKAPSSANTGNGGSGQAGRRVAGDEAAADQARVRDHALRRALRVGVRPELNRAVPVADARAPGRAAGALRRGRARGAGQRGGAAQRSGTDRRNGRQLPQLHRNRADRHRRRRTGARQRLRVPGLHADAPRAAAGQAPELARVRAGHRRSRHAHGRVRAPDARAARPDGRHRRRARARTRRSATRSCTSNRSSTRPRARPTTSVSKASKGDLADPARTPSFSYIVPDRCHDGNPTPCTAGAPAGIAPAGTLLAQVVPEILASKAYKENGLLVITVDEAPSSGEFADSSSCCGQPLFPNDPLKTITGAPRGGGAVGALLLSPYVKGGTTSQEPFNHFSLLRTIEDLFWPAAPRLRGARGGQVVRTGDVHRAQGLSAQRPGVSRAHARSSVSNRRRRSVPRT